MLSWRFEMKSFHTNRKYLVMYVSDPDIRSRRGHWVCITYLVPASTSAGQTKELTLVFLADIDINGVGCVEPWAVEIAAVPHRSCVTE